MTVTLTNAYATLTELKTYLEIDGDTHDDDLNAALNTASRVVDRVCDRTFIDASAVAATVRTYRPNGGTYLDIADVIADGELAVTLDLALDNTYSTTWTLGTEFDVDHPAGEPGLGGEQWPVTRLLLLDGRTLPYGRNRRIVKVTGRHGWPDTPPAIRQAALLLAARLHRRSMSPEGVITVFDQAVRVSTRLDPDVHQTLAAYRRTPIKV